MKCAPELQRKPFNPYEMCCGILMPLMAHCMRGVVECRNCSNRLQDTIDQRNTNTGSALQIHFQGRSCCHTLTAFLGSFSQHSGTDRSGCYLSRPLLTLHVVLRLMLTSLLQNEFEWRSGEVGEFLTVHYTSVRVYTPPFLVGINEAIKLLEPNVPMELGELLPVDRRRRYDWLEELNKGLEVPLVHVTYAPGSSIV